MPSEPLYFKTIGSLEVRQLISSVTTPAQGVDGVAVNMLKLIEDPIIVCARGHCKSIIKFFYVPTGMDTSPYNSNSQGPKSYECI